MERYEKKSKLRIERAANRGFEITKSTMAGYEFAALNWIYGK
jgi:hypothetical protein